MGRRLAVLLAVIVIAGLIPVVWGDILNTEAHPAPYTGLDQLIERSSVIVVAGIPTPEPPPRPQLAFSRKFPYLRTIDPRIANYDPTNGTSSGGDYWEQFFHPEAVTVVKTLKGGLPENKCERIMFSFSSKSPFWFYTQQSRCTDPAAQGNPTAMLNRTIFEIIRTTNDRGAPTPGEYYLLFLAGNDISWQAERWKSTYQLGSTIPLNAKAAELARTMPPLSSKGTAPKAAGTDSTTSPTLALKREIIRLILATQDPALAERRRAIEDLLKKPNP